VTGPLARRLGFVPHFDVYTGCSVGAVHACYLAAHVDSPREGTEGLLEIWHQMAFSRVYRFGVSDAWNFARTALGFVSGHPRPMRKHPKRMHGLLNTSPLEDLVIRTIPWKRLWRNIREGRLDSLCVSTTEIATGRTVNFVQRHERVIPSWTRDESNVAVLTRVGPAHTLASAAIPMLFPAVRIGATYHVDGALRQATPLTPALRLGANRLLIIGLRRPEFERITDPLAAERVQKFRTLGFLIGKILNAVLSDRLEADVAHMRVLNRLLMAGVESYGDDHIDRINPFVEEERGHGFQLVQDAFIRPSENIGTIAASHVRRLRRQPPGSIIGDVAFRYMTRGDPEREADLMSYLLFDSKYAADLIELGRQDARRDEDVLASLFVE